MSRPIRRAFRRFTSGRKEKMWCSVLASNSSVTTSPQSLDIVAPSDWARGAGLERCTLLAVRGWLAFRFNSTTTTGVFLALLVSDEDESTQSPSDVATYTDEDILWTGGFIMPGHVVNGGSGVSEGHAPLVHSSSSASL